MENILNRNLLVSETFDDFAEATTKIDFKNEDFVDYCVLPALVFYWYNLESAWKYLLWEWDLFEDYGHFRNLHGGKVPSVPDGERLKRIHANTFYGCGNVELLPSNWINLTSIDLSKTNGFKADLTNCPNGSTLYIRSGCTVHIKRDLIDWNVTLGTGVFILDDWNKGVNIEWLNTNQMLLWLGEGPFKSSYFFRDDYKILETEDKLNGSSQLLNVRNITNAEFEIEANTFTYNLNLKSSSSVTEDTLDLLNINKLTVNADNLLNAGYNNTDLICELRQVNNYYFIDVDWPKGLKRYFFVNGKYYKDGNKSYTKEDMVDYVPCDKYSEGYLMSTLRPLFCNCLFEQEGDVTVDVSNMLYLTPFYNCSIVNSLPYEKFFHMGYTDTRDRNSSLSYCILCHNPIKLILPKKMKQLNIGIPATKKLEYSKEGLGSNWSALTWEYGDLEVDKFTLLSNSSIIKDYKNASLRMYIPDKSCITIHEYCPVLYVYVNDASVPHFKLDLNETALNSEHSNITSEYGERFYIGFNEELYDKDIVEDRYGDLNNAKYKVHTIEWIDDENYTKAKAYKARFQNIYFLNLFADGDYVSGRDRHYNIELMSEAVVINFGYKENDNSVSYAFSHTRTHKWGIIRNSSIMFTMPLRDANECTEVYNAVVRGGAVEPHKQELNFPHETYILFTDEQIQGMKNLGYDVVDRLK